MAAPAFSLQENYWEVLELNNEDVEALYNFLMETEEPQTPRQLVQVLIDERIRREQRDQEKRQAQAGRIYLPKEIYQVGEELTFPMLGGVQGKVAAIRPARTFLPEGFKVIAVEFDGTARREFAAELVEHVLNQPPEIRADDPLLSPDAILEVHGASLAQRLVALLQAHDDFVYIAGRWFPRALLVDVNAGNLNLAEAVLDMSGGGPLPTTDLLGQVDLPSGVNEKLAGFSLDLALQEDPRFDEVGSTGKVLWFLKRLEPKDVQTVPLPLRYTLYDYDRSKLTEDMLLFEQGMDDEHSPAVGRADEDLNEIEIPLIYPHWRAGTLPISHRLAGFFPSAYESPRILFALLDGESGNEIPAWVVRLEKYVYGLRDWYLQRGVVPGSILRLSKSDTPGRVTIQVSAHRSAKEWVRTALVGADGGVVYATLKQPVSTEFDDRMMVYLPGDIEALDQAWERRASNPPDFETRVVDTLKELAKINPQAHVHVAELYSALNVVLRCPPGPLLALLATRPWFTHVGDLHYRLDEAKWQEAQR